MGLWDYGIMGLWDYGIMGLWDYIFSGAEAEKLLRGAWKSSKGF